LWKRLRRKELKLNWRIKYTTAFLLLLLLSACGGSDSSNGIPTAQNPTAPGGTTLNPPPTPTPPAGEPDLSSSEPFKLPNNSDYSGLQAIFGNIYPPLVGDPLVKMMLSGDVRSTTINGTIRLAVEDNQGLAVRDFPSFDGTGYHSSSYLDIIFADDQVVVRATANQSGDTLSGALYYRVRQSGETQCEKVVVTCHDQYGNTVDPSHCPPPPDTVAPCRQYMDVSQSSVKLVGTYQAKFSEWWTQN
jgi:hypothetical protein